MSVQRPVHVSIRPTSAEDVPAIFQFQLEPDANAVAGTKPRDWPTFSARWEEILRDPVAAGVFPRVIVADGVVVGQINIVSSGREHSIGYWVGQAFWGRGIATRAVTLMIEACGLRPLTAQVATWNVGSLRALVKNGFVEVSRAHAPATTRSVEREMITLRLE